MALTPPPNTCPACTKSFRCGTHGSSCWCAEMPAILGIPPAHSTTTCLCPDCLARTIGQRIHQHLDSLSHQDALHLARQQAPSPKLFEHIDYTVDNHQWVFTRWYLLKRGHCCGEKCRHCPYP